MSSLKVFLFLKVYDRDQVELEAMVLDYPKFYNYEQWWRSLLNIGGDNLQFYPNFAQFSTLGGMNLDHDFVQVWKFSEDQKKNGNRTIFLPDFRWRPNKKNKKKVFSKKRTLFSPNLRSVVHPFKLLGGCRSGIFSNYWEGYSQIIEGEISPPGFGITDYEYCSLVVIFHSSSMWWK